MRQLVVYPYFLTPRLLIPVIFLSSHTQKLSAFRGSELSRGGGGAGWVLLHSDHTDLPPAASPGAQFITHRRLHTQPGLGRVRPGHAGRCWPRADKSKQRTRAWRRTFLTVPSHHVPFCGLSTHSDLQHHSILRVFCSFLLHSMGCFETEVLTWNHSCATRLTPRQLRVLGIQAEAPPDTASFAPGFS